MGARETALNVLIACRKDGAWSNGVLKEYCAHDKLDKREAALAARLSYGVLQNRLRLDFYLKQLLKGKLNQLHPALRDILHLGIYPLYEMDRIPESAAVNESVLLAKKYCKKIPNSAALVNGVLRNTIRNRNDLEEPSSLSDRYSHPQKLVDLFKAYVGEDKLEKMLVANNDIAPMVIQVNTCRTSTDDLQKILSDEGVSAVGHPWLENCLVLKDSGNIESLESFRSGLFYVQDAAAKLSVICAGIQAGDVVLDCCAAPGGKTFAAAMAGAGKVISCDIHAHKVSLIEKGAERLGLAAVHAMVHDASVFSGEWDAQMDVVIADVPCSGYGIIRKKPDIRYKDPDTMSQLSALQLAILKNQARYVKPGGTLLYSTCTLVRKENEGVIEKFLKEAPEFYKEPLQLPDVFGENTDGMLRLIPGEYDTDGFFICRLRRKV